MCLCNYFYAMTLKTFTVYPITVYFFYCFLFNENRKKRYFIYFVISTKFNIRTNFYLNYMENFFLPKYNKTIQCLKIWKNGGNVFLRLASQK